MTHWLFVEIHAADLHLTLYDIISMIFSMIKVIPEEELSLFYLCGCPLPFVFVVVVSFSSKQEL